MVNPLVDPGARLVIAHRGASLHAPENTIEAFHLALRAGAHALELDVHAAADGTPVVIHDPDLRRTCDRAGRVATLRPDDLRVVDAGWGFTADAGRTYPYRGRGIRVPTLAEVLEELPDTPLLLELKTAEVEHAVAALLRRHGAERRCVVASSLHGALGTFRAPPFLVSASARDVLRFLLRARVGLPPRRESLHAFAVPDRWRGVTVPTPGFLAAARRVACAVHVWTVDDPSRARDLWSAGATGIVTNDPAALAKSLAPTAN